MSVKISHAVAPIGTYVSPVIGTTTGYPSRPAGANSVHYIGPLVPTDMQANDMWTDTSGSGAGTGA